MKKISKIYLVTFIVLLNNVVAIAQEKELKFEKGNITFDKFNSMFEPNAAFVLIKTDYKDLTFSSNINKDGKIKELPSLDFSNNRIFAIETEKQKFNNINSKIIYISENRIYYKINLLIDMFRTPLLICNVEIN